MTEKDCPFCGERPPHDYKTFRFKYWVVCQKCGATGPVKESKEEAERFFNNRVS